MTKTYQLTYLISPEVSFEEAKAVSQEIESRFGKEGKVVKTENPIKKFLTYPIKKQKAAYLVSVNFNLEPEKIEMLIKEIEKKPQVIRCLLTKKEKRTPRIAQLKSAEPKREPVTKVEAKEIEEKLEEILDL